MASLELGAGRKTRGDIIDYKAGIIFHKKIGDYVKNEEVICELHSDSKIKIRAAEQIIMDSVVLLCMPSYPRHTSNHRRGDCG